MFRSSSVDLKSERELACMREAGAVVAETLALLASRAEPGITTAELDLLAQTRIRELKAKPAFLGYRGFPATLCVSINEEIVHGIPSPKRRVKAGDVLSLDLGCIVDGFYGDAAITVPVGEVSEEARRLIQVTRESLEKAIEQLRPGRRLGDVGAAVQRHAEAAGFSVVREFVGHGIGRSLHEDPPVPNYGRAGTGLRLAAGMVLAVEPMVNAGGPEARVLADNWTAVTADGRLSAHFEHTIAVGEDGPEILTVKR